MYLSGNYAGYRNIPEALAYIALPRLAPYQCRQFGSRKAIWEECVSLSCSDVRRRKMRERGFSIAEVGVVKWSVDHWTVELECDRLFIMIRGFVGAMEGYEGGERIEHTPKPYYAAMFPRGRCAD